MCGQETINVLYWIGRPTSLLTNSARKRKTRNSLTEFLEGAHKESFQYSVVTYMGKPGTWIAYHIVVHEFERLDETHSGSPTMEEPCVCQFREDRFGQWRICNGRAEKRHKDLDHMLFLWFSHPARIPLDRQGTALSGVRFPAHARGDQPQGPCGSGEPRHVRSRILRPRSLRLLTCRFWRLLHFEVSDVRNRLSSTP